MADKELQRKSKLFTIVSGGWHAHDQLLERMKRVIRAGGKYLYTIDYGIGSIPHVRDIINEQLEQTPGYPPSAMTVWRKKFDFWLENMRLVLDRGDWVFVDEYYTYRAVEMAFDEGLEGRATVTRAREIRDILELHLLIPDIGIIPADPRLDDYLFEEGPGRYHPGGMPGPGRERFHKKRDVLLDLIKDDKLIDWHVVPYGLAELEYHDGLPVYNEQKQNMFRAHADLELEVINLVLGPELAISLETYEKILRGDR